MLYGVQSVIISDLEAADMYGYYRHAGYLMLYVNNKRILLLESQFLIGVFGQVTIKE